MDLIYCRGGDKEAGLVAKMAGVMYGVHYKHKPYDVPVFMLDVGPGSVNWDLYLNKVREYKPVMALTPDYYVSDRRTLWSQIDSLRSLGVERVCVAPKFHGAVSHIPYDCLVGVSVPTRYAGFLPHPNELDGRKLHYLGGHPDQVAYLVRVYSGSESVSVDMNIIGYKACHGQFWRVSGGWQIATKNRFSSFHLAVHSWRNIRLYFGFPRWGRNTKRVQRVMYTDLLL